MEYNDELDKFFKEKPKSISQKSLYMVSSLIISIIVIWFLVSLFVDNNENENTLYEEKVISYLLNKKGYKMGGIKSIEEHGGLGSLPARYVIVTFENEPYVKYAYFAHNNVVQASYYISEEEYEGITEENLINLDPNGFYRFKIE